MNILSSKEIAFLAEQENIYILPRYSTNGITLIAKSMPKLKALQKTEVPIWLAILLKKQNKCNIVIPEWLSVPYLSNKYKEEQRKKDRVSRLPWNWIPISKILLDTCPDDFVDSPHQLRALIQDLREIRLLKTRKGFKMIEDNYLELTGLSLLEINEIRPFLTKTMDTLRALKKVSLNEDDEIPESNDINDADISRISHGNDNANHVSYRGFDNEDDDNEHDSNVRINSDIDNSYNNTSSTTEITLVDNIPTTHRTKRRRVNMDSRNNDNAKDDGNDNSDDSYSDIEYRH